MIKSFELNNFGPIARIKGTDLKSINLIIGANSTGKTFLLKALYAACRAHEEFGRGNDPRDLSDTLSDKLYWTFQTEKLGDLVTKGHQNKLQMSLSYSDNTSLVFGFGPDTTKKATLIHDNLLKREANSVFLPPKEVLGLSNVIMKSALQDKAFGFDSTYSDLVLALQTPPARGRPMEAFRKSADMLEDMFQGKIEFDADRQVWMYKKGNSRFAINVTAEGIKKIAILDTLLRNRHLSRNSFIFIDEPESALHPKAITELMNIIHLLASDGIQFFIATHSYFVVKKLHLISKADPGMKIPLFMPDDMGAWNQHALEDGMPENSIIQESIRLFDEEMDLARE